MLATDVLDLNRSEQTEEGGFIAYAKHGCHPGRSAQREDPGPGRELGARGGPGSALDLAKLVRDDNFLRET
ncbi:hypothetical protein [Caulobacter sp. LjRoot300]|uniref:hypothetical protein n=1 Tax=Caulobacter sp. LjRoot300 TaxID=3342321 RepID=UPI003ED08FAB